MRMAANALIGVLSAALLTTLASCDNPASPGGALVVSTSTFGLDVPAFVTIIVDDSIVSRSDVNDTVVFNNISGGRHRVALVSPVANCSAAEGNPSDLQIESGATTRVSFSVGCRATSGSVAIEIRAPELGTSRNVTVLLDGVRSESITPNTPSFISEVGAGNHQITLASAGNCAAIDGVLRSISIPGGRFVRDTISVSYELACTPADPFSSAVIAFERSGRILLAAADGAVVSDLGAGFSPRWSPDGNRLVFSGPCATSASRCASRISVTDEFGTFQLSAPGNTADYDADWSRDGARIAFIRWANGPDQPYLMVARADDVSQSPLQLMSWYPIASPSFSPDGRRIAFECEGGTEDEPDSRSDICLINVNGTGFTKMTRQGSAESEPSWSPDGKLIAFTLTPSNDASYVAVMTPEGTEIRTLQRGSSPVWIDEHHIGFVGGADSRGLRTMDADGNDVVQITTDRHDERPSWRR